MAFHREMAAREGARDPGNALRLREDAREAWGWMWLDRLSQDLGYAGRMLRKSPGFTVAAVLMLALGIGVNVAVFGFFNLMFLRPLPIRDPDTLLRFDRGTLANSNFADNLPYPEVAFFSQHTRTLSAVLALDFVNVAMEGEDKQLHAHFVTSNFFSELGATATLGRTLDPLRDAAADSDPVVVLGYDFWQRHFGGDPSVIGKTIRLNEKPVRVIGVASPEFSGLGMGQPDLWAPIDELPYVVPGSRVMAFSDGGPSVEMWGRLQPGLTPGVAEEELSSLAAELRRQHPNEIWDKEILPSTPGGYLRTIGDPHDRMYPVFGLVGTLCLLILAVACGNLGSLLLARGVAREREISIRASVGAGRLPADSPALYRKPAAGSFGIDRRAGVGLCGSAWSHGNDRHAAMAERHARLARSGLCRRPGLRIRNPVWSYAGLAVRTAAPSGQLSAAASDRSPSRRKLRAAHCRQSSGSSAGSRHLRSSRLRLPAGNFDRSAPSRLLAQPGAAVF